MEENNVSKSSKIKVIIITALIFLVSIAGISYAYFTIQITGNDTASSMRLRTANMSLIYNDVQIVSGDIAEPGWTDTKTFTVTNTGNVDASYIIKWREIENTIVNAELVLSATCVSSSGTCDDISQREVVTATSELTDVYLFGPVLIEPGVTHTYTLTVEFIETGSNQNYNQNKYFNGTLNIGDGTATTEDLFEYGDAEDDNSKGKTKGIAIYGYYGLRATFDLDSKSCEEYIESWGDKMWDHKTTEAFCNREGTDPYDNESIETWVANRWIMSDEFEDFGISNVNYSGADVIIPSEIDGQTVVEIADNAFMDMFLTSVIIPDTVTSIGMSSFYGNELTSIYVPEGVTYIGDAAFALNQITSAVIPNGIGTISENVFGDNLLASVVIPNGVKTIENGAFGYNQLTSIIIPDSVETIEQWAFGENQITSVDIPNSVSSIGDYAFYKNQISSVRIPNTVTSLGKLSFNSNNLPDDQATFFRRTDINNDGIAEFLNTSVISYGGANKNVVVPGTVTLIEASAYAHNNITSVTLPPTLRTINSGAFSDNLLTTVTIPSGVSAIQGMAFYDNPLRTVIIEGKTSSRDFKTYGNSIWGWADDITCTRDNTSMIKNGCIYWNTIFIPKEEKDDGNGTELEEEKVSSKVVNP